MASGGGTRLHQHARVSVRVFTQIIADAGYAKLSVVDWEKISTFVSTVARALKRGVMLNIALASAGLRHLGILPKHMITTNEQWLV